MTKALDGYAKVEPKAKDDPQPVLDALEKVVSAAKSAKSANAKDKARKPVVDFLNDVLDDAATMKVKAERFLQEKAEREREGEDEDEGGDNERPKLTERLMKVKKMAADAAKPFVLAAGQEGARPGDREDRGALGRPQEACPGDARRQRQGLHRPGVRGGRKICLPDGSGPSQGTRQGDQEGGGDAYRPADDPGDHSRSRRVGA